MNFVYAFVVFIRASEGQGSQYMPRLKLILLFGGKVCR